MKLNSEAESSREKQVTTERGHLQKEREVVLNRYEKSLFIKTEKIAGEHPPPTPPPAGNKKEPQSLANRILSWARKGLGPENRTGTHPTKETRHLAGGLGGAQGKVVGSRGGGGPPSAHPEGGAGAGRQPGIAGARREMGFAPRAQGARGSWRSCRLDGYRTLPCPGLSFTPSKSLGQTLLSSGLRVGGPLPPSFPGTRRSCLPLGRRGGHLPWWGRGPGSGPCRLKAEPGCWGRGRRAQETPLQFRPMGLDPKAGPEKGEPLRPNKPAVCTCNRQQQPGPGRGARGREGGQVLRVTQEQRI